ncbi:MAG: hypothetical protein CVV04_11555 [Firmicutes bacterium HGW-Firmicutes-9]|nr:MAG: hypothetical protein CVV04_11555 [Firmicutes bacterium HGW-Firmicutes-9]
MFNSIGTKIKVAAKVITWIGIIGSIIAGIIIISIGLYNENGGLLGIGFGILLGGSFISWISSWFIYGYGELIEKTSEIAKNTSTLPQFTSVTARNGNDIKMQALISWRENNLISDVEFEMKKQAILRGE